MSATLTNEQIKSVALFFYLALLEETAAARASQKTIRSIRDRISQPDFKPDSDFSSLLVAETHRTWKRFSDVKADSGKTKASPNSAAWQVPESLDLGPWRQFHRDSNKDEMLTVIWSSVLNISADDIAAGLGLSPGTIRYRIGNGLKQLGPMILTGNFYA